jgi:drug/metabolite transporter (DMT)-like permease
MIFLWLSIFCSTSIYLVFKWGEYFKVNLTGMIIVNYLFASLLGLATQGFNLPLSTIIQSGWLWVALLIGLLFVAMFYLIGISTQKAGISVTSTATRMSMVIPVLFSMLFFDEETNTIKLLKILIVFIAVTLAIFPTKKRHIKLVYLLLPFILFIGSGSVDTLVKTAQHHFVPDSQITFFSTFLFATSFFASFLLLFINKNNTTKPNAKSLVAGVLLGGANFGSLYFIMKALNHSGIESSLVFGINNLAIVALSLIAGYFLFKERLSRTNTLGIILSIVAIILLTF